MMPKKAPSRRILIVEESQEIRDGIEELLRADTYSVDTARDDDDAVMRACLYPPDLLLIALAGSLHDLLAIARSIRERADLAVGTPVVIFSISALPEGTVREMGDRIMVVSPDNFNQLRAVLARALQGTGENT